MLQTESSNKRKESSNWENPGAEEGRSMENTKFITAQGKAASPKKAYKKGEGGELGRATSRIMTDLNIEDEGGRRRCMKTMS